MFISITTRTLQHAHARTGLVPITRLTYNFDVSVGLEDIMHRPSNHEIVIDKKHFAPYFPAP
jgi:hypothetical protein